MTDERITSDPPAAPPSDTKPKLGFLVQTWNFVRSTLIATFVLWQLLVMIVRNPLDIWFEEITGFAKKQSWWPSVKKPFEKVDFATYYYACFTGCKQGWNMFSSPLAKWSPFMTAKLHFADGSTALVLAENEYDPSSYFRFWGWRQRKMEGELVYADPDELYQYGKLPLYSAWVRWRVREWREANPNDKRKLVEVEIIKRWYKFPEPGNIRKQWKVDYVDSLAFFAPDGTFLRGAPEE